MFECDWCLQTHSNVFSLRRHKATACKKKPDPTSAKRPFLLTRNKESKDDEEQNGPNTSKRKKENEEEEETYIIENSQPEEVMGKSSNEKFKEWLTTNTNASNVKKRKKEDEEEMKCLYCDMIFKKTTNIKNHLDKSCPIVKMLLVPVEVSTTPPNATLKTTSAAESNGEKKEAEEHRANKKCPYCDKVFTRKSYIQTHIENSCPIVKMLLLESPEGRYVCPDCNKEYNRLDTYNQHIRYGCKVSKNSRNLKNPEVRKGQTKPLLIDDVFQTESAFDNYLITYQIMNNEKIATVSEFLENKRDTVKRLLQRDTENNRCIKFSLDIEIILEAPDCDVADWCIKSENHIFTMADDSDEIITEQYNNLKHRKEEEFIRGSGWRIIEILNLILKTNKYEPLRGSSFLHLPKKIYDTKSVINPQNGKDEECFKYAILASVYEGSNAHRITNLLTNEALFNWSDLTYPLSVHDVKIFEKNNPTVSVSVYALDEDDFIAPVKFSEPKAQHIDLLLITEYKKEEEEEEEEEVDAAEEGSKEKRKSAERQHYAYIKDFEKLFSKQISNHNGRKYICKRCITHHSSLTILNEHKQQCKKQPLARIVMPKKIKYTNEEGVEDEKTPTIKFNQPKHSVPVPVRVYADSEALLMQCEGPENDPALSSSAIKQHHVPMSFGYYVVSDLPVELMDGIPLTPKIIRNVENPAKTFIEDLIVVSKKLKEVYELNEPMQPLTNEEIQQYEDADSCYMCDLKFIDVENPKVRDHCHASGKYRGAAHKNCNINAINPNFLPVYLHNNSSYDAHFIIKQLGDIKCNIKIIRNNSEQMITFSIIPENGIEIRFLDSFRFMATSLENLTNNLEPKMFVNVEKHFGSEHMGLLRRKGVFCYDYVNDLGKLKEKKLPKRKEFYSKLYEEECSKADYKHAKRVFKTFECKDLGEYSDLYLKLDVLLLADAYEAFRKVCFMTYNLDPCWYFTCPGLAWDAALKLTQVELDLIEDEEMLLMIEKGIRGGVAQCIKRYARARNGKIKKEDNGILEFLMYLDANNLYGWAMINLLPKGGFFWGIPSKFTTKEILDIKKDASIAYIFEVDITYPDNYHNKHKDLPFLPETRIPPGGMHPKLLTTLYHKEKYVLHYRLLQQALNNGLEIKKVHRVIGFNQSPWLKEYIMLNTRERQKAKNAFQRDFYKLMNNAVFGKTMEQVRNRVNMELVNQIKRLRKLIRSPFFKSRIIYDENLCAVISQRKKVVMNKPIYVGMAILDLSKYLMYEFHYDVMLPRYGAALSLCYMDTDSYIYHVNGVDIYAEMKKHLDDFDTSDYPRDNALFSDKNMKVLGKFKDEANSKPVELFVGLKAKVYAPKYDGKIMKRAKGVKRHALKKKIGIRDYISCLKEDTKLRTSFRMITSKNHELFTREVNRLALTRSDDKRFILPNLLDTLPHGHRDVPYYTEIWNQMIDSEINTDHIIQEPPESTPPNPVIIIPAVESDSDDE